MSADSTPHSKLLADIRAVMKPDTRSLGDCPDRAGVCYCKQNRAHDALDSLEEQLRTEELNAEKWRNAAERMEAAYTESVEQLEAVQEALRFWVNRAKRYEAELPADRQYMKARGVGHPSFAVGMAAVSNPAISLKEPS